MKLLIGLVLATLATSSLATSNCGSNLVCYYGSWATYRQGVAKYTADELVNAKECTHIIYGFVGLNEKAELWVMDAWNDVGDEWKIGAINKTVEHKKQNPHQKILVAMGGWNEGSEKYSRAAADPAKRKRLVDSVVQFCVDNQLDGFDLDWEYPTQRGGTPQDRETSLVLLTELKAALHSRGLILTIATSANALFLDEMYDVKQVADTVDMVNVMSYDLHGSWESTTGCNAPLRSSQADELSGNGHLSVERGIQRWIELGADPCKINVGTGSYGRSFTLKDPKQNGIGAPATGPGSAGSYVAEAGFLGYNEICVLLKQGQWTRGYSSEHVCPYAYRDSQWVGYDDVDSLVAKVALAKRLGCGGMMLWSIETDDFRGDCGQGTYPLVKAMSAALTGGSSDPELPPRTTPPPPSPSTVTPTTEPATVTGSEGTSASTSPPAATEKPSGTICQQGKEYVRDPKDCSVFYRCVDQGATIGIFKQQCPDNLYFDETTNVCNYSSLVDCPSS